MNYWRWEWQPTLISLPGECHGQKSLVGYSPWGRKELDTTEWLTLSYGNHWMLEDKIVSSTEFGWEDYLMSLKLTYLRVIEEDIDNWFSIQRTNQRQRRSEWNAVSDSVACWSFPSSTRSLREVNGKCKEFDLLVWRWNYIDGEVWEIHRRISGIQENVDSTQRSIEAEFCVGRGLKW